MIGRIARFIERNRLIEAGLRVGAAVSGGADSVCLLDVLVALAPRWNLRLVVLHLDHGLRGEESREDARFVARLAAGYGLPVEMRAAGLAAAASRPGVNLEKAGREARHAFFLELLSGGTLGRVALGHTLSDQAETVLYRMLRGAGPLGLAGMAPARPDGLVRPLLCVTRAEVEDYLRSRGIPWRNDSSNCDPRFARNRIRHQLLPQLAAGWNPALAGTLARTAAVLRDEESWWEAEIDRLAAEHFTGRPPEVILNAARVARLHRAVARRLLRRALEIVKGDLLSMDFAHVEQALDLVAGRSGRGRLRLPGVEVTRSFGWVRLAPPLPPDAGRRGYSVPVTVPGRVTIPGLEQVLVLESAGDSPAPPVTLELRNWRPGDAYQPAGCRAPVKLKALFQKARVPRWERSAWPVLAAGGRIVWARRFGASVEPAGGEAGNRVLKVSDLADISKSSNPGPCM